MSVQNINGYQIERFSIGDDDFFDIDWLDGAVYQTAKVKGSVIKALAAGVNIYNSDGTLISDRVLDGDGFALAFDNLRKLEFNVNPAPFGTTGVEFNVFPTGALMRFRDATTTEIRLEIMQNGSIRFNEEYIFPLLDGNVGDVLTSDGSGNLSFQPVPVAVNIYNSDGVLTGNRIAQGSFFDLFFLDHNSFIFQTSANGTDMQNGAWFDIEETNILTGGNLFRIRKKGGIGVGVDRFRVLKNGQIEFNEEYKFPLLDGSNGQYLQTDGSGNLSWQTIAGSGDMLKSTYDPNNDGVVLSTQKTMVSCINQTGALVPKGSIVYLKTSSSSGTYPEIVLASNIDEPSSSKTIGAVYEDIPNSNVGFIVTNGEVDNLNTTAYSIGTRLWLGSTAGSVTTTPPVAPLHSVFIGIVTRSQTINGRLLYSIINGFELEELHNVLITSPIDGQTLQFDSTTSLWKNVSPSSPTQTDLDPVINSQNAPPPTPTIGDRYRIGTGGSGAWIGQNNNIAEWNGTSWIFTIPVLDDLVFQTATATTFRFNGTSWLQWAGSPILQNGNTFGGTMRIGTNDANNIHIKRGGVDVFIHQTGQFSQRAGSTSLFYGTLNFSGLTLSRNYTMPNQNGTIALLSDIPSIPLIPQIEAGDIRRGVIAINGTTTQGSYGGLTPTNTGSVVAVVVSVGNTTPYPKFRLLTSAGSTNSVVGVAFGNSSVVHKLGFGFRFIGVYSITDRSSGGTEWFVPNARHFCGLASVGTILGISSTITLQSQLNIIGIGSDATDVNLQLFHNDGVGTATKIDLGSFFPANKSGAVQNTESYRLELFNEFGTQNVLYKVTKLSNGLNVFGTITGDVPTDFIAPQIVRTSGSTSQNVSLDIESLTAYTPN